MLLLALTTEPASEPPLTHAAARRDARRSPCATAPEQAASPAAKSRATRLMQLLPALLTALRNKVAARRAPVALRDCARAMLRALQPRAALLQLLPY